MGCVARFLRVLLLTRAVALRTLARAVARFTLLCAVASLAGGLAGAGFNPARAVAIAAEFAAVAGALPVAAGRR